MGISCPTDSVALLTSSVTVNSSLIIANSLIISDGYNLTLGSDSDLSIAGANVFRHQSDRTIFGIIPLIGRNSCGELGTDIGRRSDAHNGQ